jgi:hypothetical protein
VSATANGTFSSLRHSAKPNCYAAAVTLPWQALLAQGADTNQEGPAGELPLVVALQQTPVDITLVQVSPGLVAACDCWPAV